MDKHIAIIGSGLGGLTCGYLLAKKGFKVSIFEKNRQTGGCLQTFTRRGIKFETGMHYIGSMGEGESLNRLFGSLELLQDMEFKELDRQGYDTVSIRGDRYSIPNGEECFIESLSQSFPEERHALRQYWNVIREVAQASPLSSFIRTGRFSELNNEHLSRSASSFIEKTVRNPLLQQILAGNAPLYAGVRDRTSLYTHALVRDFYSPGAFRIVGGSDRIAISLARSILRMGGEIFNSATVTRINCNTHRAESLELSSGERIEADFFISNIHPSRTLELIETPLIRKAYRERITSLDNTASNFTVYLCFRKNTVPYLNSNFFHYSNNVWNTCADGNFLYMHLCNSINQSYADAAILIANMNFEDVARWKGTSTGRRGEDYEAFKTLKAEYLITELDKQFPGIKSNIETYFTSSPLTYLDYTGTENGSTYGILHDCNSVMQTTVSHRTKVPNLYLAGQNIHSHGILGVIAGAFALNYEFRN